VGKRERERESESESESERESERERACGSGVVLCCGTSRGALDDCEPILAVELSVRIDAWSRARML